MARPVPAVHQVERLMFRTWDGRLKKILECSMWPGPAQEGSRSICPKEGVIRNGPRDGGSIRLALGLGGGGFRGRPGAGTARGRTLPGNRGSGRAGTARGRTLPGNRGSGTVPIRKKAKPHGAECPRSVVRYPVAGGRPRRSDQHRPAHLHAFVRRRPARTSPVRVGLHVQQRADVRVPHHAIRPSRTCHAHWAIQPGRTPHLLARADLDPDAVAPRWTMAARWWTERHGSWFQVAIAQSRQGEEVDPDHGPDHVDLRPDGRDVGPWVSYG